MKCINCGAELSGSKCEYCGSDFGSNHGISGNIDKYDGYITVGGVGMHVYMTELEVTPEYIECGCLGDGTLRRMHTSTKRRFTLVEY